MPSRMCDETAHPSAAPYNVEVWKWIRNFVSHFIVVINTLYFSLSLHHRTKKTPIFLWTENNNLKTGVGLTSLLTHFEKHFINASELYQRWRRRHLVSVAQRGIKKGIYFSVCTIAVTAFPLGVGVFWVSLRKLRCIAYIDLKCNSLWQNNKYLQISSMQSFFHQYIPRRQYSFVKD